MRSSVRSCIKMCIRDRSHHGAIKLYSKENEGTTFTVRIPLIYIA